MSAKLGDLALRRAVMAGIDTWLQLARLHLGPGRAWIAGGFVSAGEPDDRAMLGYLPNDESAARDAMGPRTLELVTLISVIYSFPSQGGFLPERWPVSGLVDAYLVDRTSQRAFSTGFSTVVGPDARGVPGVSKGFVEVQCP